MSAKHVIALSGGKDSTCLALALSEYEPREYEYICTPTGNEPQELFDHLSRLEDLLNAPINRIGIGLNLYELIEEQKMIPNHRARFCTRMLKIDPTIDYMRSLPKGSLLYVGLRADEPFREGIYGDLVSSVFPFREWGWKIQDIWTYLGRKGVEIPPRTDCGVCFYQRIGEWWNLWRYHPDLFAEGEALESKMGHTFRSDERDSWPTSLNGLRGRFELGEVPRGHETQDMFSEKEDQCRACSL